MTRAKLTDQNRGCLGDFANILVHLHDLLDASLNIKTIARVKMKRESLVISALHG